MREIKTIYPNAPLFTIHDGALTTEEYVKKLNGFVLKRLKELTEVLAVEIKASQIDPNPQLRDIPKFVEDKKINQKQRRSTTRICKRRFFLLKLKEV
jgi:hypothetical protein